MNATHHHFLMVLLSSAVDAISSWSLRHPKSILEKTETVAVF